MAATPVRFVRGIAIIDALGSQDGPLHVRAVARLIGCEERRVWEAVEHYNNDSAATGEGFCVPQIVVMGEYLRRETREETQTRHRLASDADKWAEAS